MSAAAQSSGHGRKASLSAVVGNTARKLSAENLPGGPGTAAKRERTPLAVVAGAPARRKVPFAVFCFAALVAALATVLMLNISVSSGQYELVKLKSDQSALNKVNQDLTQQLQNAQAPQNLANKARELGMVSSTLIGQVNVETGTVAGNPTPAVKQDKPLPVIAAPAIPGLSQAAGTPADSLPADSKPADGASTNGNPATGNANGQTAPANQPVPPAEPVAPPVDLRGGTIPSPLQKTP